MVRHVRAPTITALIAVIASVSFNGCTEEQRERFRQSICMFNQKQVVMAARMYAADWDGVFPWVGNYSSVFWGAWDPAGAPFWGETLRDYLRRGDLALKCPNVITQPGPSYAWNRHLSSFPEDLVEYPAVCPLTWDWTPGYDTAPGIPLDPQGECHLWAFYPSGSGLPDPWQMGHACCRHERPPVDWELTRGLILAFVDGHASFELPTQWTPAHADGRFMRCEDGVMPWPPHSYRGKVISMYPMDPAL